MYNNFFNSQNRNYNNNNNNFSNQNKFARSMSNNSYSDNSANSSTNNSANTQNAQNLHNAQHTQRTQSIQDENSQNNSSQNLNLTNNERLRNIDPIKLKIIMEIRDKSRNKSIEELLPEIMKINQELNRRNMNFTKDETAALMDVIEESLSPADRQKFNMFKGFMS
ncbi:MAG: hypothetical protein IJ763_02830 [Lachnospiraceae bacterium]|nr:hypothetical protein [Lachnospiraceae bacterium]